MEKDLCKKWQMEDKARFCMYLHGTFSVFMWERMAWEKNIQGSYPSATGKCKNICGTFFEQQFLLSSIYF